MKKVIFLLLLCFSIVHVHAQNEKKNIFGTHIALGTVLGTNFNNV